MEWKIERAITKTGNNLVIPWTPGHVPCAAQIECTGAIVNNADTDPQRRNTLVISFLVQGQPHVAEVVYLKDTAPASGAALSGEETYGATLNVSVMSLPWYLSLLSGGHAKVQMEPSDPSQTQLLVETFGSGGGGGGKKPPVKPHRPVKPKPTKPPKPPKKRRRAPGR